MPHLLVYKKKLDAVNFKKSLKVYLTENEYHKSVEGYLEVPIQRVKLS